MVEVASSNLAGPTKMTKPTRRMAALLLSDSTEGKPASSMNRRVSASNIEIGCVTPASPPAARP